VDYIRKDIEGSDSETRRKAACDLIRGLCQNFDEQVCAAPAVCLCTVVLALSRRCCRRVFVAVLVLAGMLPWCHTLVVARCAGHDHLHGDARAPDGIVCR
jgi:hypothetical protein